MVSVCDGQRITLYNYKINWLDSRINFSCIDWALDGAFHLLASARTQVEAFFPFSFGIVSMNLINHRPEFLRRDPNGTTSRD